MTRRKDGGHSCTYLPRSFSFNEPSRNLQEIKSALLSGLTVEVCEIDEIDCGADEGFAYFVLFLPWRYEEAVRHAVTSVGIDFYHLQAMYITQIGSDNVTSGMMESLVDGFSVFLIPECDMDRNEVTGRYTLVYTISNNS